MRSRGFRLGLFLGFILSSTSMLGAPFVLFPKAGRLVSPSGRFEVREVERAGSTSEFVGTFHSLWLLEKATGRSRKLCDYIGVAAVAWSGDNFLVVTQYMSKKTSRALLFATAAFQEPVVLDVASLVSLVPVESRDTLRHNDHIFVEASSLEADTFFFRVWGYGQHDPGGFHWDCQFALREATARCVTGRP